MKLEKQIDELIEQIVMLPIVLVRDIARLSFGALLLRGNRVAEAMIDEIEAGRTTCGPYLLLLAPALFVRMIGYTYDAGRWSVSARFDMDAAFSTIRAIFGLGKWDALGPPLVAAFAMVALYDLGIRALTLITSRSKPEDRERLRKLLLYQAAAVLAWAPLLGWILVPPLMPHSGAAHPYIRIILGIGFAFLLCFNIARAVPRSADPDTRAHFGDPMLMIVGPLLLSNFVANCIQVVLLPSTQTDAGCQAPNAGDGG